MLWSTYHDDGVIGRIGEDQESHTRQPPSRTRIIKRKFVLGYGPYKCIDFSKTRSVLEQFSWQLVSRTVPQSYIDLTYINGRTTAINAKKKRWLPSRTNDLHDRDT